MNVQQWFDSPNFISYILYMKTAVILYSIMVGLIFVGIIITSIVFNYFPTSKISGWFRRHVITDEDLEGTPPPSDESGS